jgi:hypothetical protein
MSGSDFLQSKNSILEDFYNGSSKQMQLRIGVLKSDGKWV